MTLQSFSFEQLIKARPALVYHAFTNSTVLREWMCDLATTSPKIGGRVYMAWNSGFYMAGEYLSLDVDKEIVFSWNGRGEPGPTLVRVRLEEKDSATLVSLTHEQVGDSRKWQNTIREIQEGWEGSLENLASVLETGQDLRITSRPMLGIHTGEFNAEIANRLGVPVSYGIRLEDVVEGMGAQKAGLQANDVLVKMAGIDLKELGDYLAALKSHRAGDQIEITFYRNNLKIVTSMELSKCQHPDIPGNVEDLAMAVGKQYDQMQTELDQFSAGISEKEASHKPSPEEWSIMEIFAHLIQAEGFWRQRVTELVGSQESWADEWTGNWQSGIDATLAVYPSLSALFTQLKLQCLETQALYAHLPEHVVERKGTYWRLAVEALEMPFHFNSHLQQMQAVLDASRKG